MRQFSGDASTSGTFDTACDYVNAGLSVLPIRADGSKAPAIAYWKKYQQQLATAAEIQAWFLGKPFGLAILGGRVSGSLEIIDFDDGSLCRPWAKLVSTQLPGLIERLSIVQTPSGGYHVYYRCPKIAGNQKLAQATITKDARSSLTTLIETRGEGGYVLAPGCPVECHPQKRPYVHLHGPTLTAIGQITAQERQILLQSARAFHRVVEESVGPRSSSANDAKTASPTDCTPWDDFNQRGPDWAELLPDWKVVHTNGHTRYWRRPGKQIGHSATTGYCRNARGDDLLAVFSSNAHPFAIPPGKTCGAFTKFAVYALLCHRGDFKAAARALAAKGYGSRKSTAAPGKAGSFAYDRAAVDDTVAKAASFGDDQIHLTDLGNGRHLVQRHGQDLRYCHVWEKWLAWDGRRWAIDQTGEAERRAKETVLTLHAETQRRLQLLDYPEAGLRSSLSPKDYEAEKNRLRALLAHYERAENVGRLRAMLSVAASEPSIPILPDELDGDPWLLNVRNGTLDLRTGQLRPHDRRDKLTKLAPVEYDPQAPYPLWEQFLRRITNNNVNLLHFLRRMAGLALTGDVSEQCLFFLYGKGANGKSTFLGTLLALLGDYGMQAAAELLMVRNGEQHPTERADLQGRRLVSCIEVEEGKRLAEALIKQLTGGDKIRARRMHEDFWQFDATHKLFLAGNHKPNIRGRDHAIWRRIHLVPFTVTIPDRERDKALPDKLKAELSGILNWCLEGCVEWQRDGLGVPLEVKEATKEYRDEMDIVGQFLDEQCERRTDGRIVASQLYAAYKAWAEEGQERPLGRNTFFGALEEHGLVRKRSSCTRNYEWYGLVLRPNVNGY